MSYTVSNTGVLSVAAGDGIAVDQATGDVVITNTAPGAQGSQGAQGYQGNQGSQGAQGYQGNQGSQGAQGYQGNQGSQGYQGYQGYQGNQGSQGYQGYQGYQGNQGSQGYQGNQGAPGYQGTNASVHPTSSQTLGAGLTTIQGFGPNDGVWILHAHICLNNPTAGAIAATAFMSTSQTAISAPGAMFGDNVTLPAGATLALTATYLTAPLSAQDLYFGVFTSAAGLQLLLNGEGGLVCTAMLGYRII